MFHVYYMFYEYSSCSVISKIVWLKVLFLKKEGSMFNLDYILVNILHVQNKVYVNKLLIIDNKC